MRRPNPDELVTRKPPPHPMPRAPDMQFLPPPVDPIGVPTQPVPATEPARSGDDEPPSRAARWLAAAIILLLFVGMILLFSW